MSVSRWRIKAKEKSGARITTHRPFDIGLEFDGRIMEIRTGGSSKAPSDFIGTKAVLSWCVGSIGPFIAGFATEQKSDEYKVNEK